MSSPTSILVIGAGVIGLSTATMLQARYPHIPITILAAELPTPSPMSKSYTAASSSKASVDYASMWAGAHYRPIPRSTRQLAKEANLAMRTASIMKEIAREMPEESGVEIVPAEEYLEVPAEANLMLKSGDPYAWEGDDFQVFKPEELSTAGGDGLKWGCKYMAWVVNVHIYCNWLLNNFKANGGQVVQRRLKTLENAFEQVDIIDNARSTVVVNCSGRNFDNDTEVQVIRGQTVLVRNRYHKTVTRQNADGSWAFLIPRPLAGGTIVGGTKEIGDLQSQPREDSRRILLEQAVRYFPDFVNNIDDFQIVTDNVGRRPWRDGGLRIEIEELGNGHRVVHGYGAGGRGYELSWGAAEEIVALVEQSAKGLKAKL